MKKPTVIAGIVLVVVLAGIAIVEGVALAKSDGEHRSEIQGVESQLAETDALLTSAKAETTQARAESASALEDLERTQDELTAATTALTKADSNVRRLRRDYNSLYSDFERLYNFAAVLVGQSSYQPTFSYQPIHCTTSTISGRYMYTDCY